MNINATVKMELQNGREKNNTMNRIEKAGVSKYENGRESKSMKRGNAIMK